jgi:hypothetical protein
MCQTEYALVSAKEKASFIVSTSLLSHKDTTFVEHLG